ncbi:MAG: hypothetical protein MI754_12535, partial [Chromatiales bacterium]|nr:hypothetical protein [Chromatiales bacterium]
LPKLEGALSLSNFLAYQGESFLVYGGEDAREVEAMRLVEVLDKGADDRVEQFWLRFQGQPHSMLKKSVYNIEHSIGGRFQLWLEPNLPGSGETSIWVRFNILKHFDHAAAPKGIEQEEAELAAVIAEQARS